LSHVTWSKGGEARIVSIEGERIRLASTTPAAPGTPLEGALASGTEVRVKVARCRREGEHFVIEGRLVDASKVLRAALTALAEATRDDPS
jgi:hypothetical protein